MYVVLLVCVRFIFVCLITTFFTPDFFSVFFPVFDISFSMSSVQVFSFFLLSYLLCDLSPLSAIQNDSSSEPWTSV